MKGEEHFVYLFKRSFYKKCTNFIPFFSKGCNKVLPRPSSWYNADQKARNPTTNMPQPNFLQRVMAVKDKLFRFAFRLTGQRVEAEDVVQEVFLRVWNKREQADQIANLEAFCMQIARNLSIDRLRQKDRQHSDLEQLPEARDIDHRTPEQWALQQDLAQKVRQLVEQLPIKQKMVLQLRDIEEMSYQEIAQTLDISMDQVKVNLFRARNFIREQLLAAEQYGLSSNQ